MFGKKTASNHCCLGKFDRELWFVYDGTRIIMIFKIY